MAREVVYFFGSPMDRFTDSHVDPIRPLILSGRQYGFKSNSGCQWNQEAWRTAEYRVRCSVGQWVWCFNPYVGELVYGIGFTGLSHVLPELHRTAPLLPIDW